VSSCGVGPAHSMRKQPAQTTKQMPVCKFGRRSPVKKNRSAAQHNNTWNVWKIRAIFRATCPASPTS